MSQGFFQIVVEPHFVDGADGVLLIRETGQQDSGRFGLQLAGLAQKLQAVHLGHQEVGDDDVDGVPYQVTNGLPGIFEQLDFVVGFEREKALERAQYQSVVIDGDDAGRFCFGGTHCFRY